MKKPSYDGLANLTIGGILKNHAMNYPRDLAVVDVEQGRRYTYEELNRRVNRVANSFLKMGMRKGDKIVIYLNDRVEWLEIIYAVNKIGAVWIPCNYRLTGTEVRQQVEHCEPRWFFFSKESHAVVESIKPHVPFIEKYVVLSDKKIPGTIAYSSLFEHSSEEEPEPAAALSSDELVGIIYTSGTTGVPKGAMHTHRTFLAWAFTTVYELGMRREDRLLNPYPMFHMGGLIFSATSLFSGASNFILGKFEPLKFIDVMEREKITMFCAVPTIISTINGLPQKVKDEHGLATVRSFFTSSAPLFTETREAFLRQWPKIQITEAYTATEIFFTTHRPRNTGKARCVGSASFGSEITIMDKNGNVLPQGQAGLVYGRGISRFIGYYKNPGANAKSSREDWFTCEDVGYRDPDGDLFLVDRAKDMIISGGENIASGEVENIIVQHPAIFECAVIGIPDEQWGEKVCACVSLKPGQTATPEEIMEWCRGRMAGFKRPKDVRILPEIPKSPVGKVLKRELRASQK